MYFYCRSISFGLTTAGVFLLAILTFGSCSNINNLSDMSTGCDAEACHPSTVINRDVPTSGSHASHLNSLQDISCTDCHYNYGNNSLHKNGIVNGYDSGLDKDAAGNIISFNPADNPNGSFDTASNTCNSINCHISINWYSASEMTCAICHYEGSPNNPSTGSHSAHIRTGQTCEHCHAGYRDTAAHNDDIDDTGITVNFNTRNPSGVYSAGECSNLVCHGSSLDPAAQGTDITPVWGNAGTGACGTCHYRDSVNLTQGAHSEHLLSYSDQCGYCHDDGDGSVGDDHHELKPVGDSLEISFFNDPDASFNDPGCSNIDCHGTGSPVWTGGSGINCIDCHVSGTSYDPFERDLISSGSHSKHYEYPARGYTCTTCHNNYNNATTHINFTWNSGNPAGSPVSVVSILFGAYTGTWDYTISYSKCTDTGCHGGKQTPDWYYSGTGLICSDCHEDDSQDNRHDMHVVDNGITCDQCHNQQSSSDNHVNGTDDTTGLIDTTWLEAQYNISFDGSSCSRGDLGIGCHGNTGGWPKIW